LSPNVSALYYWRGDSFSRVSRLDEAISDFTRALDLAPGDHASRVGRGAAQLWRQEWGLAIADFSAVLDQSAAADRWSAWAHRGLGLAYAGMGRNDLAVAEYRTYLTMTGDPPDRPQIEGWIAELESST
jgi:tetratricopeptide (TPR) repeat protein